ncbi:Hypothetical predicted protein [Paramuricea clavata]|uniref:Uncharacterized protein n=1 Tax=Paramuricea clavata TaxID=317549 RepID=A0A6S7LUU8_PARCT|nr:Hypothetical predicted protein [Paramuricea clavata]
MKILSFRAVWLRRFLSHSLIRGRCFFDHHISLHFRQDAVVDVLICDPIPAYLVKKLPLFYGLLVRAWIDLKGTKNRGMWVIPCPSSDFLPFDEITAKLAYKYLLKYHHVEHRLLAKFQNLGFAVQWQHVCLFGVLSVQCKIRHGYRFMKFNQLAALSDRDILFGLLPSSGIPVVFTALLGVLRHHVWLAHNSHRFENIAPDSDTMLKKAKSTFLFLVRMHQRHCHRERFVHEWLADGVIGSITQQDWIHFTRDFVT